MTSALSGIRVADFSHVVAGPYCTMILADLGAYVVKIEPPTGDAARGFASPNAGGDSTVFLSYNRNKKSIVIDLAKNEGKQVARDIIARSDVLVENFSAGVMQRLGLDYAAVQKINPRIIYCAISAYGRSGEFSGRAGYDQVVQAESGFMSLNGYPDMEPLKTPIALIDVTTGMFAAHAILAALYARETTQRGQYLEATMFDNALGLTGYYTFDYILTGKNPPPPGNSGAATSPSGVFKAKNGRFFLSVAGERVWNKLIMVLGNPPDLTADRFSSNILRVKNRDELTRALEHEFGKHSLRHLIELLQSGGIPAGPIRSISEALSSPEAQERAVVSNVPHTKAGTVPNLRLPLTLTDTPLSIPHGAPLLGEHTKDILSDVLGYDDEHILSLQEKNVLGKS